MNYFNYFTEIEDTFVRRRGKHLLLSPIDWAMIDTWQERGIPLHIALRGIEEVFDNFDKNPGPRTIKSLMFCREEVEAQYQEWLASQAGKASGEAHTPPRSGHGNDLATQRLTRPAPAPLARLARRGRIPADAGPAAPHPGDVSLRAKIAG